MHTLKKELEMLNTTVKQKDILYTYKEGTVTVVVCRPKGQRRPITAKPKGSLGHYGRTNAFGVRV
jgi:hypothetical protein